jgi:hypothetical protein
MKKEFTKEAFLESIEFCVLNDMRYHLFLKDKQKETILDILNSPLPLKYRRWIGFNCSDLSLDDKKELVLKFAWVILPIYEEAYPEDKRLRDCLMAIEDYNTQKITLEELKPKVQGAIDANHESHDEYEHMSNVQYSADGTKWVNRSISKITECISGIGIAQHGNNESISNLIKTAFDAASYAANNRLNQKHSQDMVFILVEFFKNKV